MKKRLNELRRAPPSGIPHTNKKLMQGVAQPLMEERTMYFKTWLKRFEKDMSPRGDLARDVRSDREFPRERALDLKARETMIRRYLEDAGACYGCMAAFEDAWKEYEHFYLVKSEFSRK